MDQKGLLEVEFNTEVINSETLLQGITNQSIQISLIPSYPIYEDELAFNMSHYDFTWEFVSLEKNLLKI